MTWGGLEKISKVLVGFRLRFGKVMVRKNNKGEFRHRLKLVMVRKNKLGKDIN